ncbi:MAG: hypothetical protein L7S53_08435 [Luminiphilus sp.]|nr:hypothetical protein [Luminiphilus sp.]
MRSLLSRFLLIGVALFATPALAVSNSSGGINVSPSVQGISTDSCETYGTSGAYVQKIFMAYLGRPAAPAALEYYASFIDLDVGQGKLVLFDDLYYSAEAQQLYRSMPLADQINQFYVLMFGREAKTEGIEYWVGEIEAARFTVPAAAAFIADAASAEDLAVLDAKQVAASKVTCAIGDDEGRLSVFQSNLDEARSSLAEIVTAEQAEAYTGYEDLIVVVDPEPTPLEPQYDLYNRDVQELNGLIDFPGCEHPNPNLIKTMLDVDLDGDQDVIMGFECLMYTQDVEDLIPQLTYDEFYGWITDSYLAVFINDNGVFRNDQSIFDGEYPVYDKTLKSWWAINVGDINVDGYDDLSIHHHWDNSEYNSINERLISRDKVPASEYWNAGSVIISDGEGGYKAHLLPMQTWQSVPQFYTDELGDTYVWLFSNQNTMFNFNGVYDDYQKRELDLEVRPYVGKVSGADLIDVTDRYWEKLYNNNSRDDAVWCYIARSMAVDGEYQGHAHHTWQLPCSNPENWLPTNYAVEQLDGKVYVNPARGINHNQIYTGDDRIAHCWDQSYAGTLVEQGQARKQCSLDASTNQPWMFDSLAVLAMDSERGVYVENTHQHQGEFRYYLNNPDVPVSEGGDYETLFFIHMDDQIQINAWGWGLTIAEEASSGDLLAMSNMGGTMLDPGATIDHVEELANFILRQYEPETGDWSNTIGRNITDPRSLVEIMKAGFCPDVLLTVEPEDCLDPDNWGLNSAHRYLDLHGDDGRSVGHRVTNDAGIIVSEPKLTNLNMAYNPFRTQLIDFDGDGDLDLYINDNNQDCGPMCLMENLGDYEFEQNIEGIWSQADTEFWDMKYQEVDFGYPETEMERLFQVSTGEINIRDIDGDGILDFHTLKFDSRWGVDKWDQKMFLNIIYGEF